MSRLACTRMILKSDDQSNLSPALLNSISKKGEKTPDQGRENEAMKIILWQASLIIVVIHFDGDIPFLTKYLAPSSPTRK